VYYPVHMLLPFTILQFPSVVLCAEKKFVCYLVYNLQPVPYGMP
jgi:hypothetical protein